MVSPDLVVRAGHTRGQPSRSFSPRRVVKRFSAWLAPPLGEAVRPASRHTQSPPLGGGDVRTTLNDMARRLRGAWRVAVVRRALQAGLVAGCLAALAAGWAGLPHWLGPVLACLAACAVGLWGFRLAPGTIAAARFLDHRLALKEQLATALELDSAPLGRNRTTLEAALARKAGATLKAISNQWSFSPVPAAREWGTAIALVALLAVIVMIPFGAGNQAGIVALPSAGGSVAGGPAPDIPIGPADSKPFSVQVAVVSTPDTRTSSSGATKAGALPTARVGVARTGALGQSAGGSAAATATPARPSAGANPSSKATPVTPQHTVPLIQGSQGFLPTSPSAKGQKSGTFADAPTKSIQSPGSLGSQVGGSSSNSTTGPSSNGKGNNSSGKSSGSPATGTASSGKAASGTAKGGICTVSYACNKLNPNAVTAPGLITGKGQFTGQGGTGGQTSGHAAGVPIKPSTAKAPTSAVPSKQLTISSSYGSNKTSGERAQQVQGHNGTGTSQQTTVSAGPASSQSVDYVPPDANLAPGSDAGIVARYFVDSSTP